MEKYQSPSSGTRSMRAIPNERNIHLEINWCYANLNNNTIFGDESRRYFVLSLSILYMFTIRDKYDTFLKRFVFR